MKNKQRVFNILKYIFCIICCLVVLVPIAIAVINSFKDKAGAARMELSLPKVWHFENYTEVIEKGNLVQGFLNSLLYAFASTGIGVLCCSMAAFVLGRRKTKTNNFLFYFILCGLFLPVNYVTLVKVLTSLHLINTKPGIILTLLGSMIPFCIFVIRNFVSSIPLEMDEAAVVDGAGPVSLFFRIVMPMMKPVLSTCFILQFMGIWSDFLTPLYLSNSSKLYPMTMAVYQFFGRSKNYWNLIFADIILTIIPVLIVYIIGQKQIIGGMTSGAVKE